MRLALFGIFTLSIFQSSLGQDEYFPTKEDMEYFTGLINSIQWVTVGYNEKCEYLTDRVHFQLKDFLRAKLPHVFKRMRLYEEAVAKNQEDAIVCDLDRGMRCNFLTKKCSCAIDGYLEEDIESMLIGDETTGTCFLKPQSRCHPTLTEWLKCSEGEQCLYEEFSVLCDRDTRQKIINDGIILKSAKCRCSSGVPKKYEDMKKKYKK